MLDLVSVAFAGGTQQIAIEEPIAWYWLALVAIGLGTMIGNSFTEGFKQARKDHPIFDELKASTVKLIGRGLSGAFTGVIWLIIAIFTEQESHVSMLGSLLALVSAGLAPICWDAYDKGLPIFWAWVRKKFGAPNP